MVGIIGALFSGWILGLFGFKGVVIAGMAQLFGITINVLGYYFLFAMMGALKSVIWSTKVNPYAKNKPLNLNVDLDELKKKK